MWVQYLPRQFCTHVIHNSYSVFIINNGGFLTYRGAGATGATAPVAQTQQVALFARTAPRNLCIIHRNWNLELFLSNV